MLTARTRRVSAAAAGGRTGGDGDALGCANVAALPRQSPPAARLPLPSHHLLPPLCSLPALPVRHHRGVDGSAPRGRVDLVEGHCGPAPAQPRPALRRSRPDLVAKHPLRVQRQPVVPVDVSWQTDAVEGPPLAVLCHRISRSGHFSSWCSYTRWPRRVTPRHRAKNCARATTTRATNCRSWICSAASRDRSQNPHSILPGRRCKERFLCGFAHHGGPYRRYRLVGVAPG